MKERIKKPVWDRFVKFLHKTEKGCIEFTCLDSKGYGAFGTRINGIKKSNKAHRFAWEHEKGPIPKGMWVCHKCDNPACVNTGHLFLGTALDNHLDSVKKGRQRIDFYGKRYREVGENNHYSKLTNEVVYEIRRKYIPHKYGKIRLAREFGISPAHVLRIVRWISWSELPRLDKASWEEGDMTPEDAA